MASAKWQPFWEITWTEEDGGWDQFFCSHALEFFCWRILQYLCWWLHQSFNGNAHLQGASWSKMLHNVAHEHLGLVWAMTTGNALNQKSSWRTKKALAEWPLGMQWTKKNQYRPSSSIQLIFQCGCHFTLVLCIDSWKASISRVASDDYNLNWEILNYILLFFEKTLTFKK